MISYSTMLNDMFLAFCDLRGQMPKQARVPKQILEALVGETRERTGEDIVEIVELYGVRLSVRQISCMSDIDKWQIELE